MRLTSHEYRLLSYMMLHAGRVVSRAELIEHLYDQDFDRDSNTIEVFIGRLRKLLPKQLKSCVSEELSKDIAGWSTPEIRTYLKAHLH